MTNSRDSARRSLRRVRQVASLTWLLCVCVVPGAGVAQVARGESVRFRHEVMAVLSKAGCNAGVCHGNAGGKGGFKLSLRGQDPARDFVTLTTGAAGRRGNRLEPDRSLLLLKPTMQTAHEGGRRFAIGAPEYTILRDWIAAGMPVDAPQTPTLERIEVTPNDLVLLEPAESIQLAVRAHLSDGSTRDVTMLAVYEPVQPIAAVTHDGLAQRVRFGETTILVRYLHAQQPVRLTFVPARPAFRWASPTEANYIDRHVFAKLKTLRTNPSPLCDDRTFVRRAHLDLLGLVPTADAARAFVADERPDKRARLIARLLDRPEFADFWALKLADLLRNEEHVLDRKGVQAFHHWIRQSVAAGKPLDQFVRELVAGRGSTYANPPANYYRALRDPLTRGEATAQLFLGTRLKCAKCHNHPFDRWTQADYYSWAALFARVQYKVLENKRRVSSDRHEWNGEQIVWLARTGEVTDPRTGKPAVPRFLGAAVGPDADQDELQALARWITSADNPLFARTFANRIWYQLMGRGLVDPIDDFRATNPPSHPALLDALAADLTGSGYRLRHLIRVIADSRAYQLSSEPNETNGDDAINYSHTRVRRLPAEALFDSITESLGASAEFVGYPAGLRAAQLPGVRPFHPRTKRPKTGDRFLKLFGKPQRLLVCECERSDEPTMSQAFLLLSSTTIHTLLTHPDNRLTALLDSGRTNAQLVDELYWSLLTRPPTADERHTTVRYLDQAEDRRKALEDLAWGLLSVPEFLLRR